MKKKILIIDDEPDILKVIAIRLKSMGFEVELAETGEDGLARVLELKPDLVLLDYRLPDLDGLEVCRRIKTNDLISHIPVIMMTASVVSLTPELLEHSGSDEFIAKPFEFETLEELLKKFIPTRED